MRISLTTAALVGTSLLGLARSAPAQNESASSAQPAHTMSCRHMIDPPVAEMPAGVEKMSAQKEMASARNSLDKGDTTACNTHMKNVMEAVRSK